MPDKFLPPGAIDFDNWQKFSLLRSTIHTWNEPQSLPLMAEPADGSVQTRYIRDTKLAGPKSAKDLA
jgi:hypothetical protein